VRAATRHGLLNYYRRRSPESVDLAKVSTDWGADFRFAHVMRPAGHPALLVGRFRMVLPGNRRCLFVCFQNCTTGSRQLLAFGYGACKYPSATRRRSAWASRRRYFVLLASVVRRRFIVKPLANQCSALVRTGRGERDCYGPRNECESASGLRRGEMIEVKSLMASVFKNSCETHLAMEAVC